jgi:hypothetical protein
MANAHKSICSTEFSFAEVQVQPGEEDGTKDEPEERVPVKGSTAEEASTEDRLPEKDHGEGNLEEDSPEKSVQVD